MYSAHRSLSQFWPGFLLVLLATARGRADYPIASHRYVADPGSLVSGGRVYLYGSNDEDNAVAGGYEMKSFICVSSSDLKNWTDHGEVFRVPADAAWAGHAWAPFALEKGGKFYLYFGNNASGIGVASSASPTSEFKDAKGSALVNASTPGASGTNNWLFDPGGLIDDDGQAYLAFGGNGEENSRIIKLNADLISVSGSAAQLSVQGFFEASFMFKRSGTYYLAYSTSPGNGQRIDYLTSSSPMSGYTYRGVLAGQPPSNSNNNHASEFEFNGKWYHAYHNRYVATQAGISTTYKRNLALDALNFNTDGTIQQVAYTTDGVPQIGYVNPYERVEAETMNAQSGVETERCSEGGMDVTELQNGDWIGVRGVDFGAPGASSLSTRVASTTAGGSIEVRLGTATGTVIGTCNVPATGGQQSWLTSTCSVTGATGVKDLYFKFVGQSAQLFNFNYWQFSGSGGGSDGSGGATAVGGTAGAGGATAAGGRSGDGGSGGTGGAGGSAGPARGGSAGAGAPNTGGSTSGGVTSAGGAQTAGGSTSGGSVGTGGASAGGTGALSGGSTNLMGGSTGSVGSGGANGGAVQGPASDGCSCTVVGAGGDAWRNSLSTSIAALLWSWRTRSRRKPRRVRLG